MIWIMLGWEEWPHVGFNRIPPCQNNLVYMYIFKIHSIFYAHNNTRMFYIIIIRNNLLINHLNTLLGKIKILYLRSWWAIWWTSCIQDVWTFTIQNVWIFWMCHVCLGVCVSHLCPVCQGVSCYVCQISLSCHTASGVSRCVRCVRCVRCQVLKSVIKNLKNF